MHIFCNILLFFVLFFCSHCQTFSTLGRGSLSARYHDTESVGLCVCFCVRVYVCVFVYARAHFLSLQTTEDIIIRSKAVYE